MINTIDKKMVRTKESVHFGFPFAVPEAVTRIDLGFAVIRPEADQLPGSCKDYFSAQRWVDVSNQDYGVTLTVLEAPLVEVGDLNSELPSPRNPVLEDVDGLVVPPGLVCHEQLLAHQLQGGPGGDQLLSVFDHSARAVQSGRRDACGHRTQSASRGPAGCSASPEPATLFEVVPRNIIVSYLKPVNGGRGYIVRLFNAGGSPEVATLTFTGGQKSIYMSSPAEEKGEEGGRDRHSRERDRYGAGGIGLLPGVILTTRL